MSAARTARRRRLQASQGFTHLAKQQRPHYKRRSAEASARRLAAQIAKERRIAVNKGKKRR